MSRNKANTKSGWRRKDKAYRLEQNAKARANRDRRVISSFAAEHGISFEEAKALAAMAAENADSDAS